MQSPLAIGFFSIVPGVGFFILGQARRGVIAIGIIVIFFFFAVLSPNKPLGQLSFDLSIVAWMGQIYLSVQTAILLKREVSGEFIAPRETMPLAPPPSGLSYSERLLYKTREIVRQQLNPGEHLVEAIVGHSLPSFGSHLLFGFIIFLSMRTFHIGLTEKSLIVIEHDFSGKPIDIKRLPFTKIKSCQYRQEKMNDEFLLDFGNNQILNLRVSLRLRESTKVISAALRQQNAG